MIFITMTAKKNKAQTKRMVESMVQRLKLSGSHRQPSRTLQDQARGLGQRFYCRMVAEFFPQRSYSFFDEARRQAQRAFGAQFRREVRAAVAMILPGRFAEFVFCAELVEQVIANLISGAEQFSETR
jgi:hypothetical protein